MKIKKVDFQGHTLCFTEDIDDTMIIIALKPIMAIPGLLNEPWSCDVSIVDNTVVINGDEDYFESPIETVDVIGNDEIP